MASRNCRVYFIWCLLAYLVILLFYTGKTFFSEHFKTNEQTKTLLAFTIKLNKNGDRHTEVLDNAGDENLRFSSHDRIKDIALAKENVLSSNELIFINKKEFNNGLVQLDETKIKQTNKEDIVYETHQEVYSNNKKVKMHDSTKYIFSLRYYEQLSMATKNLLSLASLGTSTGRHVVTPFVNNSRFCGLRSGTSMSRLMGARSNSTDDVSKFSNMSTYFNMNHFNNQLLDNGYNSLVSFNQFKKDCSRLDTVVHFLYEEESSYKDMEKWYKLPRHRIDEIKRRVKRNGGIDECKFVQKSKISRFLGNIEVKRYICVDPDVIKTVQELEEKVFKNSQCVAIIIWKGIGPKRAHFSLAPSISKALRPSDLKHSKRLIDIAYSYIREIIKRPFISVHVRSERHLIRRGLKAAKVCIKKLKKQILTRKSTFNLKKVFLASDLVHGSDTLLMHSKEDERQKLRKELNLTLDNPYTFNPAQYRLYDRGEIAIVEMHILSMGESLFTLGRGNFNEWIVDLFLLHNAEDKSLIYKICNVIN